MATHAVSLDIETYNYRVDVSGRRIWLEDTVSERQWQWVGTPEKRTEGRRAMPETVALAALKSLLDEGGRYRITLAENRIGGLRLRLRLPRSKRSWTSAGTFELEAIPSVALTQTQQMRRALVALQVQLKAMEHQIQAMQKMNETSDKNILHLLESMVGVCVVVAVSVVFYMGLQAIARDPR